VTRITLLAVKVDGPPEQPWLDTEDGLRIRLEVGVHLDLTDASADTCIALANLLLDAAAHKRAADLKAVAA